MSVRSNQARTICVSFSGVDGAGKTTQIDALRAAAERIGLRVRIIRFWDDVACFTRLREISGHRIFKGDKGIGSVDRPINRRDKNIRSWPMSCVRLFLYSFDAFSTRSAISKARRSGTDLFIFDRYLYDELVNLGFANPLMRSYVRLMMLLTPRPDISFVLDADPQAARARKPEYPLEFVCVNRRAYLELSRILGGIAVIEPMPIEHVKRAILNHVLRLLTFPPAPPSDDDTGIEVFADKSAAGAETRPQSAA